VPSSQSAIHCPSWSGAFLDRAEKAVASRHLLIGPVFKFRKTRLHRNFPIDSHRYNFLISASISCARDINESAYPKVVKVERDLLKEKLNVFLRKLFAAKSEARGNGQSDLFNEAEALASAGPMAEEVTVESGIEIAGHTRQKRVRKPLDPTLPREIVRHELSESERSRSNDGNAQVEIGVEISEQHDIIPQ